jgi:hypothetical protein
MLRGNAVLTVPEGVTGWHAPDGSRSAELKRIHVQRVQRMAIQGGFAAEMDARPAAELWYDCRLSRPRGIDWIALQREAEAVGGFLSIEYAGIAYRVSAVDELPDTHGGLHHYRMELI